MMKEALRTILADLNKTTIDISNSLTSENYTPEERLYLLTIRSHIDYLLTIINKSNKDNYDELSTLVTEMNYDVKEYLEKYD